MCGIVGYIGKNQAAPILLEGLSKLEYEDMTVQVLLFTIIMIEVAKSKGKLAGSFQKN